MTRDTRILVDKCWPTRRRGVTFDAHRRKVWVFLTRDMRMLADRCWLTRRKGVAFDVCPPLGRAGAPWWGAAVAPLSGHLYHPYLMYYIHIIGRLERQVN